MTEDDSFCKIWLVKDQSKKWNEIGILGLWVE